MLNPSRNQMVNDEAALRALLESPGWAIVLSEIERRERATVNRFTRGGLSHEEYGRASGECSTFAAIRRFPSEQADSLAASLEASNE